MAAKLWPPRLPDSFCITHVKVDAQVGWLQQDQKHLELAPLVVDFKSLLASPTKFRNEPEHLLNLMLFLPWKILKN